MLLPKLAYRNILRQRRRSILTALSMTGGYILCSFTISLLDGTWGNLVDYFTRDHTGHIQIHAGNYLDRPKLYKSIKERSYLEAVLTQEEDVQSFAPRVFAPALAYAGDKNTSVTVIGVDPSLEKNTSMLSSKVKEGNYFSDPLITDGYYPAIVGLGVADSLNLGIGDEIILISQGADGSIANDIYLVSAKVGTKTSNERQSVYLPITAAQEFLSMGIGVHEYALLLNDSDESLPVAAKLTSALQDRDWVVSPWQKVEEAFYKSMQADKRGGHVMLGIVVFLVCIGVLNTVVMSVLERTREFGVLRAIGTKPSKIMAMIIMETSILALFSCLLGLIIATPLNMWFTFEGLALPEPMDVGGILYERMKGELSVKVFALPLLVVVASAAAVSILPSIRAARITLVDALGSH
jgi:ABC-type lipoprotein release transport system permease subunit|tara:strand:+ start:913 stop:2139 length:1227 start_codon:yes stop_codon:yes gene_type:complete